MQHQRRRYARRIVCAHATTSPRKSCARHARAHRAAPDSRRDVMSALARHFATMAYNNAWSNHRLLHACARLTQQDFVAPRTGFFPSIKATLNHIVTVDWYYVDALERWRHAQPVNGAPDRFFEPE